MYTDDGPSEVERQCSIETWAVADSCASRTSVRWRRAEQTRKHISKWIPCGARRLYSKIDCREVLDRLR